jgi:peroxiredoxin Q/BCP
MIMKNNLFLFLALCVLILPTISNAKKHKKEKITLTSNKKGSTMTKAPEFSALDETGTKRSLSEFKGKKVVLYFYPKDFTSTCTKQACSLRNDYDLYKKHNIVILGINYDTPESHTKFIEEHNLPFPILTDADHSIAKAYNANGGLTGFLGYPQRKTYLIDEEGNLVKEIAEVDVATQAADILNGFNIKN